ncbi:amphi-Trp domain-containing protein [Desulfovibrio sp. Huiquan2017]|uniref:amphi-Trp domain-containing protein n=1 Tax=Desulfovibrio sp. Huiquan2017 TaxID=2816861 RepID=UPI001A92CB01|nr:amphi-Trp domain-containing protein [Desulfovibrio sp. Huiquan2017]
MAEEKFVFDSLQDCGSIKDFLESLIEGFEKRSINLSTNGNEIHLEPEGLLNFTIKARKKGTENKISIKVSWKDAPAAQSPEDVFLKVR